MSAAMSYHFNIAARKSFCLLLGAVCSLAGAARGGTLLVNGTFDAGAGGWTKLGGTAIIATGELSDNPYARLPDGALTLLYQKAFSPAPQVAPSPARAGWHRFSALVNVPNGQPWLALTFQNLNGNDTAADSAFLVDNVEMLPIPEPTGTTLLLAGGLFCLTCRRRASLFLQRMEPSR